MYNFEQELFNKIFLNQFLVRQLLFLLGAILTTFMGRSQSPTFSKDIAPIIYKNCTGCHRNGEIGPMSLSNYQEVKNWASMIEYVTGIRYMPPWKADPSYSSFLGERSLSDEEISLIGEWVAGGMPQGDPALEPDKPVFPNGSQVGDPDLVLSFKETYEHYGGNEDEYRIFVFPTGFTVDKDIAAIELRPGNTNIVHHALFTYDVSGKARELDAAEEGYGYQSFGGFGFNDVLGKLLDGYVPGQKAVLAPESIGMKIPQGADLVMQIHYAPVPYPESDSSTINIFFKKEQVDRYIQQFLMLPLPNIIDEAYLIPPNQIKTFHGKFKIFQDISLLSVLPHMHLLGTKFLIYSVSQEGDTTNLIKIDDWDFNWQNTYHFDRMIPIMKGSVIHALAEYDNRVDNPLNPNSPPKFVTWGEKTTDEMYFIPFNYVLYQEGDEDIVFSEDISTSNTQYQYYRPQNKIYPIFPNPSDGQMTIGFSLAKAGWVEINLYDTKGNFISTLKRKTLLPAGTTRLGLHTQSLPNSTYILQVKGQDFQMSEQFLIAK